MKRNGMCPICYLRQFFMPSRPFVATYRLKPIDNGAPKTSLMGWSSWNTFRNRIDETLILETAHAMLDRGLAEAGYRYVNLDDNWHSSRRTDSGELQADPAKFPRGMTALMDDLHAMGLKGGLYSSNGTMTCEDLPASLHREREDARTLAAMGVDYLKYDFCHHEYISVYAPLVYGVELLTKEGPRFFGCEQAALEGTAKRMPDKRVDGGWHVSGLDKNLGAMTYTLDCAEEGDYVLTLCIRKKGNYPKALAALVNGEDIYLYDIPEQKHYNYTARFQNTLHLQKGSNSIRLFNPIARKSDSAFLQYYGMGKELAAAAKAREGAFRPIVYSICEWGWNKPYRWGALAGNMWRTTPDIRPIFPWIKWIYGHNVKLYKWASPGHVNDPDMLEVGNGKLTYEQNLSHFSLWCMMAAPLVLGNDIRHMPNSVLEIVTNRDMIAIDQDPLCKPCKRLKKGTVDVLARPLADGRTAICLFNRSKHPKQYHLDIERVRRDPYIDGQSRARYAVKDVWEGKRFETEGKVDCTIEGECVKVLVVG